MINLPPYPKHENPNWKGLTLREMQMRRIVVQTRMEIEKYRMSAAMENLRDKTPLIGQSGILRRLSGMFSIAEYAMMGFKVIKWIVPLFKRHR